MRKPLTSILGIGLLLGGYLLTSGCSYIPTQPSPTVDPPRVEILNREFSSRLGEKVAAPVAILPSEDIVVETPEQIQPMVITPTPYIEDILVFVGDTINTRYSFLHYEYPPFESVFSASIDLFKNATISGLNLEMSVCSFENFEPQIGYKLLGFPEDIVVLEKAGIDFVVLANNHVMNGGEECFLEMLDLLDKHKITYVGAGRDFEEAYKPKFIEVNGHKYAFLAYVESVHLYSNDGATVTKPGVAEMRIDYLIDGLEKAKEESDFIIVSMHAGDYISDLPNREQIDFAKTAIDNGADLVWGHHSHVIQPFFEYKGKYVFPGIGNWAFDDLRLDFPQVRHSLLLEFTIDGQKVLGFTPHMFYNRDLRTPILAPPDVAEEMKARLYAGVPLSAYDK